MLCLKFSKAILNIDFFWIPSLCHWSNSGTFLRSYNLAILTLEKRAVRRKKEGLYNLCQKCRGLFSILPLLWKVKSIGHQEVISGKGSAESLTADHGWFHHLKQVLWCVCSTMISDIRSQTQDGHRGQLVEIKHL